MLHNFLNFYTKYPWVAVVIVAYWLATAYMVIRTTEVNVSAVLGIAFLCTIIFAYFGFKIPRE